MVYRQTEIVNKRQNDHDFSQIEVKKKKSEQIYKQNMFGVKKNYIKKESDLLNEGEKPVIA